MRAMPFQEGAELTYCSVNSKMPAAMGKEFSIRLMGLVIVQYSLDGDRKTTMSGSYERQSRVHIVSSKTKIIDIPDTMPLK